jgi:acetyl esterase/lipase
VRELRDLAYGPHGERNLLDLYLPDESASPRPLVVCIHGGGWAGGGKEAYEWMGRSLAGHGFAAASITYRFWPQWLCPAAMDDAQRAVRWLRRHAAQYRLDPARVGAIGGSAGAHLAAYLGLTETRDNTDPELAAYPSRVQCVVDCYGPVDFVAMMNSASAPIVEGFIGKPLTPATEAEYRQASPFHLVPRDLPPFLIVHGALDTGESMGDVPIGVSAAFHEKLRQAGGDSAFIRLETAPHGFSGDPESEHTQRMWAAAVPFLEKHLG